MRIVIIDSIGLSLLALLTEVSTAFAGQLVQQVEVDSPPVDLFKIKTEDSTSRLPAFKILSVQSKKRKLLQNQKKKAEYMRAPRADHAYQSRVMSRLHQVKAKKRGRNGSR